MCSSGTGSPCGACKFLRRKCASDCVFAPYFSNENGAARFAAIHKVFGASNATKLLLNVPEIDRCDAVMTIAYEAQARLRDPVYGCVAHIFALQRQVASLQAQLMQTKMQLARSAMGSRSMANQSLLRSPQSSLDRVDNNSETMCFDQENLSAQITWSKRRAVPQSELGELQALASRMMGDEHTLVA